MSSPLPYLVRMLLFLWRWRCSPGCLHEDLLRVFMNTPILNGDRGRAGDRHLLRLPPGHLLWPEVKWLRRYQHREEDRRRRRTDSINLLAPMATMLGERDQFRLSPTATRAVLDGIATRLDERRELAATSSAC
jgi:hypothetical protein